jgi:lipopolysaccharide/colanic/teichoic acid biosynthesis glycosyltransferase
MTLKRTFDLLVASAGLALFSPLLVAVMLSIWLQDRKSPFYIAPRAARGVSRPLADSCVRTNWMN